MGLIDAAYDLEYKYDWDYVENEGGMALRFDFRRGELSLWIYESGTADGHAPKAMRKEIEALPGIDTQYLEWV